VIQRFREVAMTQDIPTPERDALYRFTEVRRLTGLSRTTIRTLELAGDFPARIVITPRTIAWRASEVHAWVSHRISKPRAPIGRVGRSRNVSIDPDLIAGTGTMSSAPKAEAVTT
jgi:prophage regulatory protein